MLENFSFFYLIAHGNRITEDDILLGIRNPFVCQLLIFLRLCFPWQRLAYQAGYQCRADL